MTPGGYRAIDALRLEKGYRAWGSDLTPETTPYEAGLGFAVKRDKGEFIGRDAIEREPAQRLVCLVLDDPRSIALGSEPVRHAGGEIVGRVTSGGYGYAVSASIALAYVPAEHAEPGTGCEVDIFGMGDAEVRAEPLYDPTGERVRSVTAAVVVIGGGIAGVSFAYHLAKAGRRRCACCIEKGELTSGSTHHAAGLVTQFNPSPTMMRFRRYSVELYRSSASSRRWARCGSPRAARACSSCGAASAARTASASTRSWSGRRKFAACCRRRPRRRALRRGLDARRRIRRPAHRDVRRRSGCA